MQNDFKKLLISKTKQLINEIPKDKICPDTFEWYLNNNLQNYLYSISNSSSIEEIKKSNILLNRFCIDSMDWNSKVSKSCDELIKLANNWIQYLKEQE